MSHCYIFSLSLKTLCYKFNIVILYSTAVVWTIWKLVYINIIIIMFYFLFKSLSNNFLDFYCNSVIVTCNYKMTIFMLRQHFSYFSPLFLKVSFKINRIIFLKMGNQWYCSPFSSKHVFKNCAFSEPVILKVISTKCSYYFLIYNITPNYRSITFSFWRLVKLYIKKIKITILYIHRLQFLTFKLHLFKQLLQWIYTI